MEHVQDGSVVVTDDYFGYRGIPSRSGNFQTYRFPVIDPVRQARFFMLKAPDNLVVGLPIAALLAFVSTRCALWWGNWMSRVQR